MNNRFQKEFIKHLKQTKSLGILMVTSGLEILRGLLMSLGIAWGVKWITDGTLQHDVGILRDGIIVFTGSILIGTFVVYLINQKLNYSIISMHSQLRTNMVHNVLYSDSKETNKNDVLYRVNNNITDFSNLYKAIHLCIGSLGKISGTVISGFILSWHLTLALLVFGVVKIFIDKKLVAYFYGVHDEINKKKSSMFSAVMQIIQGIIFYKLAGDERATRENIQNHLEDYNRLNTRSVRIGVNIDAISNFVDILALLTVLFIGSFLAAEQAITVGAFVAFVSMYDVLLNPYKFVSSLMREYQKNKAGCISVFELLGLQIPEINSCEAAEILKTPFQLKVESIKFGYDKSRLILNNIQFEANSGRITYLTGKSGIGKTTLLNLINGLYKPLSGKISVVGEHKTELNPSLVTCVSQSPFLFNGTISENIALTHKSEIDETRLVEAAQKAGLEEFVLMLSNQYEHVIKDGGENLSGGQKCRIALARMFYNPSPLILLDEIYASLDNITISSIEHSLKDLCSKNHCVLFISHRDEWIPKESAIIQIM
ncbi:ABC transporter ATP-binding protein [Paenibacillus sp. FSL R7-0302]|uniref:ABC transporter ATP-binding protein n=1 Tax=Paenibacillus sp. FSL R7-0302 TaxID=2921681 RepID=UPI0030F79ABB